MKISIFLFLFFLSHFTSAQVGNRRTHYDNSPYRSNYQRMSAGDNYTLEIRNGAIWAYGTNLVGQLGDGTNTDKKEPVQISSVSNWVSVSAGGSHAVSIQADGTLWAWGGNSHGSLGDGSNSDRNAPVRVGTATNWISISAGSEHTLAIQADGTLWGWGLNIAGQVGDGTNADKNSPVQIGSANNWVSIAAGGNHSYGIQSDGSLWAWGDNTSGWLGDGTNTNRNTPVRIGSANTWVSISAGTGHTLGIKANGTLWAWGKNLNGQLGDGTAADKTSPIQIGSGNNWTVCIAGDMHSSALQADGSLWAWGGNWSGQLGDNSTTDKNIPVQITPATKWVAVEAGYSHTVALSATGFLSGWGNNSSGQLADTVNTIDSVAVPISTVNNWVRVATGGNHGLGLRSDGSLWVWGSIATHTATQLGNATWIDIAGGNDHSIGIQSDGTLWAWGQNYYGQIGNGSTMNSIGTPIQISSSTDWVAVSAGLDHTMALKANGTLWTWGNYSTGALGRPNVNASIPQQMGTDTNWIAIESGGGGAIGDFSMALKSDGTLWAWGNNSAGQLGTGNPANTLPVQVGSGNTWVSMSGGQGSTLAIKADGTLWGWGYNGYKCLGDSTTTDRPLPVQVGARNNTWIKTVMGTLHGIGLRADGKLWSWGYNWAGQLGDGTNGDKIWPVQTVPANVWGDIGAGGQASMAFGIKPDHLSYCGTGEDNLGQLGDGLSIDRNSFHCTSLVNAISPVAKFIANNVAPCAGKTVNFTDQSTGSPTSWNWTFTGGSPGTSTSQNPVVTYSTAGTYKVRLVVSNSAGTDSVTKTSYITVDSLPVAGIVAGNPDTLCAGDSSQLSVTGSRGFIKWQLSLNGISFTDIPGLSSPDYNTSVIDQTTYYRIKSTGTCGIDTSTPVKILVNPLPTPVAYTSDSLICSGDSTQVCTDDVYTSYLWNTGVTYSCTEAKNAGGYWVRVSNSFGCTAISNHRNIDIYQAPPVTVAAHGDTLASFDEVAYQWFFNSDTIPGANSNIYIAPQTGDYAVQVTDTNGCTSLSNTVHIMATNINELSTDELLIYPNPFYNTLIIQKSRADLSIENIEITDVLGRKLLFKEVGNSAENPVSIDVISFPEGIYLIMIQADGQQYEKKMIKQ